MPLKLISKLLLDSTVPCKSPNPPAKQGDVQLLAKSTQTLQEQIFM